MSMGSSKVTWLQLVVDGKLLIDTCEERFPSGYRLLVQIQSPRVPSLAIDGGGSMVTAPGFASQAQLAAAVNGGGRIDARSVDAIRVAAAVNDGGDILVRPRAALSAPDNGCGHVRD